MALILASASPRRRQLLALLTPAFTVAVAPVREADFAAPDPARLAQRLALEKCRAVAATHPRDCVLGFDTVVEVDGAVLGKPRDAADAARMLRLLSGRTHRVHTGVAAMQGQRTLCRTQTTAVRFATLNEAEIAAYVATPEPYDKAGGYGIQGAAARFVLGVEGCYFNVVGLPVRAVYEVLTELGVPLPFAAALPET